MVRLAYCNEGLRPKGCEGAGRGWRTRDFSKLLQAEWLCLPPNVEALTPNVMVFKGGAFGR